MDDQPDKALGLVGSQPGVERVGVAGLQEAVSGHLIGGLAIGDLQHCRCTLSDVGPRVVISGLDQLPALGIANRQLKALDQLGLLSVNQMIQLCHDRF